MRKNLHARDIVDELVRSKKLRYGVRSIRLRTCGCSVNQFNYRVSRQTLARVDKEAPRQNWLIVGELPHACIFR